MSVSSRMSPRHDLANQIMFHMQSRGKTKRYKMQNSRVEDSEDTDLELSDIESSAEESD